MQKPFTIGMNVEQEREKAIRKPFTCEIDETKLKKPFTCEIDEVNLKKPFTCEIDEVNLKTQYTLDEQMETYDMEQKNSVNQAIAILQEEGKKEEKRLDFTDCANYIVMPTAKIVYINRKGEEIQEKEKIHCRIFITGKEFEEFEVLTSEIHNIAKFIGKRYSAAMVDYTVSHVEKMIENAFRYKTYMFVVK